MEYQKQVNRLLNTVISVVDSTEIVVIGSHSLPLWFKDLTQPKLPDILLDDLQAYPLSVDICLGDTVADYKNKTELLNSIFRINSDYSKIYQASITAHPILNLVAPVSWFSRCKKTHVGRYSVLIMHPVDTYYFLREQHPEMAKKLITLKIVTQKTLDAVHF